MILKVKHHTNYSYSERQRLILQSHRLYPSKCNSQTVLSWDVIVEGALFGDYFLDGAGDKLRTMSLNHEVDSLDIEVLGEVETKDLNGLVEVHRDMIPVQVYKRSTALTEPSERLHELAAQALTSSDENSLNRAHDMMNAVSEAVEYIPGSTSSEHTAEQALAQGKGVCQDQTHCLLAISRINQIPARYVTGYLYDHSKGENYGESHAWAELNIEGIGWVGFDAANSCCPDHRYVRIGSGLDSLDAALIRGVTRGLGNESMLTSVVVSQAQQ